MRSTQGTSLYMEKYQCWSNSVFNDFTEGLSMQSYLQMILLSFLLYMKLKHLQMISIKIWKYQITLLNKHKKSFLLAKQKKYIILRQGLIILVFLSHHTKSLGSHTWHQVYIWWTSENGILKISKTLLLLQRLQNLLPRSSLITIYKIFVRPHLDYGDFFYDQANKMQFHQKLESIQYNAYLAITGAIRGTFQEKL